MTLLVLLGLVLTGFVLAETNELSQLEIEQRISGVEAATNLTPEARQAIVGYYTNALLALERRDEALKQVEDLSEMIQTMEQGPTENPAFGLPVNRKTIEMKARAMSISGVESQIARLQTRLAIAETKLQQLVTETHEAFSEPEIISKEMATYQQQLLDIEKQLNSLPSAATGSRMARARRISLQIQYNALKTEMEALSHQAHLARAKYGTIQNTQVERKMQVQRLQQSVEFWGQILKRRRSDVAFIGLREALRAERLMKDASWPPKADFLLSLATNNSIQAYKILTLEDESSKAETLAQLLQSNLAQVTNDFAVIQKRLANMGLSQQAGELLRSRRAALQLYGTKRSEDVKRRDIILQLNLASDDLLQERQKYDAFQSGILTELEKLEDHLSTDQSLLVSSTAYQLLQSRLALLERAGKEYNRYLQALNTQEITQRELVRVSRVYRNFINRNLVWTKSSTVFPEHAVESVRQMAHWLSDTKTWRRFIQDLTRSLRLNPVLWGLMFVLLLVLTGLHSKWRILIRDLTATGENAEKDTIFRDISAVLLLIIRQAGSLLVLYVAFRLLAKMPGAGLISVAFWPAASAVLAAIIWYRLFMILCDGDGIAPVYFRWDRATCLFLAQQLRLLILPVSVLVFVVVFLHNAPQIFHIRNSLGRLFFILLMLFLFARFHVLLKRTNPPGSLIVKKYSTKILGRQYTLFSRALIWLPMLFALMAFLGYYFTAYTIVPDLGWTLYLVFALLILSGLFKRALRLTEVKVAILKKTLEQEAEKQKQEESSKDPLVTSIKNTAVDVPEIDTVEISADIALLIRSILFLIGAFSLWLIWADVFPASQMFNSIELWTVNISTSAKEAPILAPVTLLNLIQCLLWILALVVGSKTIPTLLEVLMTRFSRTDGGIRNAVKILCDYVIIVIAMLGAFSSLRIGWHKFQWLAAAMTFGLSFGLQDIFSNFVSGIIILFERPIRLGDTITVAGISGTVTRIRIRATTITDWDKKEVIIPNKTFLSTNVINWSLSNSVSRVVIDIGVAYGSDVDKAEEILMGLATKNELVLTDPAPSVLFTQFGADSLDLNLRVFVAMPNRTKIAHELRHEINQRFAEAGIDIPFAQRNTHLNTATPLEIRMINETPSKDS